MRIMSLKLYKATKSEMSWVNAVYEEIQFLPSDFNNEYIVIAEVNGEKAGLGRLIQINDALELGGMYVKDNYRGNGIAQKIVEHLLAQAPKGKLVYCIPFAHLVNFYKSFGFLDAEVTNATPQEIKHKIGYCSQTYKADTLLLQMVK